MRLHDLKPRPGAKHRRKRLGIGESSGHGKTSGRGGKGQTARSGSSIRPGFEGGQMPLQRRVPKRGFRNPFRRVYEIVNLRDLARLTEDVITPEVLHAHRLVDLGKGRPVKLLGDGTIRRKVTVRVHAASAAAEAKVRAAGGTVERLES